MLSVLRILIVVICHNFSFGTSFMNSTIRRVPEDCSDMTFVTIDEIRTKCRNDSQIYYVIYANHSLYVRVDGITRDHFPIVRLQSQPKELNSNMKNYLKNCQMLDDYNFGKFGYSLKNQSGFRFIGFNYLWLGCPQSMCLDANIDAATRLLNGTVYLFRGNYYWDLKFVPLVERAHKITEWNRNSSLDNDFNHGYFNSVVTNKYFTSFFKNDRQYIWDSGKIVEDVIHLAPSEFQFKMDAAFFVINGSQGHNHYIRGQMFITDRNPFKIDYIKNIGIPWDRVDAAFGQSKTIHIFKDWYYLKLTEDKQDQPKVVFKDIYNCPQFLYEIFGGYHAFLRQLAIKEEFVSKNLLNETKLNKLNEYDEFRSEKTIVIIISIITIISIIIFIIIILKRQTKYSQYVYWYK